MTQYTHPGLAFESGKKVPDEFANQKEQTAKSPLPIFSLMEKNFPIWCSFERYS